jgi:hypothetical protein
MMADTQIIIPKALIKTMAYNAMRTALLIDATGQLTARDIQCHSPCTFWIGFSKGTITSWQLK